jgi:hypothetical protein
MKDISKEEQKNIAQTVDEIKSQMGPDGGLTGNQGFLATSSGIVHVSAPYQLNNENQRWYYPKGIYGRPIRLDRSKLRPANQDRFIRCSWGSSEYHGLDATEPCTKPAWFVSHSMYDDYGTLCKEHHEEENK